MSSPVRPQTHRDSPTAEVPSERAPTAASHTELTALADRLAHLELERDAALAERDQLRIELNVRNCALDSTKTHFMILDMNQRGSPIIYTNRAMAAAHGYDSRELLGQSAALLIAAEECASELEKINEAMRSGTAIHSVLQARRKDGTRFTVGMFNGPVRDASGKVTHYVVVGADITARLTQEATQRKLQKRLVSEMQERERMATELRLAHKLEAVGHLAAGIAHEINTPVQYVGDSVYFLQTAARDLEALLEHYRREVRALPPHGALLAARERLREAEVRADLGFLREEIPRAIERALDGIGRVTHIVRAIKEFAHPDPQEQAPADINRAIETTLIVARNEYKYCATVETHLGELPAVVCNIGELNQVFVNLIVNAAHAIQAAGRDVAAGRIVIRTEALGEVAAIRIADNGCGIPEQHLERIFDPFFTTKEVGKGTGQGLAIARAIIVERHAGRLEATSEVGAGTEFVIRLPIAGRGEAAAS